MDNKEAVFVICNTNDITVRTANPEYPRILICRLGALDFNVLVFKGEESSPEIMAFEIQADSDAIIPEGDSVTQLPTNNFSIIEQVFEHIGTYLNGTVVMGGIAVTNNQIVPAVVIALLHDIMEVLCRPLFGSLIVEQASEVR